MREKAKDVKRDKCPGCGKMRAGRLAMVRGDMWPRDGNFWLYMP
nr:MAG TPA: Protein of unknown function (DUF2752) [Caudoviricetes sp.]